MKVVIIGYSGSGKSTLADIIGAKHNIPVLHMDSIHFESNWAERDNSLMLKDTALFMENSNWVIDGNYSKILYARRMEEADQIIFMNFTAVSCLIRVIKRYFKYKGKARPSMREGCNEKIDQEFIMWVIRDGRTKAHKERYKSVINSYPEKVCIINNQKELSRYINSL